jgi:hypothetical protein
MKNERTTIRVCFIFLAFVVFISVNAVSSFNIFKNLFHSTKGEASDYKAIASRSHKAAYMAYIGMQLKETLGNNTTVVFPMDEKSTVTTAYKANIGPSSKKLPFGFSFQPGSVANNSDLMRLALHAYPVVIKNRAYNHKLTENERNELAAKSSEFERQGYTIYFFAQKGQYPKEYYVYTFDGDEMFIVPSDWKTGQTR